ncbi:MAG TPA: hypothetical protein VEJ18_03575 [Planctomycetota bacterium]|nr:hypothetical protein [Planctomycetota bacterium]
MSRLEIPDRVYYLDPKTETIEETDRREYQAKPHPWGSIVGRTMKPVRLTLIRRVATRRRGN